MPDILSTAAKSLRQVQSLLHFTVHCTMGSWTLLSAAAGVGNQRVKARGGITQLLGFLPPCFKTGSGWVVFPGRKLLYFCTAQFAPVSLLVLTALLKRQNLPVPCWLEPTAAGPRPSSNSQLLGNMLWGQAGALHQLYAMLSESCNKQIQTLLLDFGNCCLRDRFAYKYPLFSLWLFTREAGKKKGSLLLQNLPAPAAVVASSHLSSSSLLFQPPRF